MSAYYLAAYIGSGTDDDPYRPSGVDGVDEWHSIDLRPPGDVEGRAILRVPAPLPPSPQRVRLGDDLDASIAKARSAVAEHLGVRLDASTVTVRHLIADLLIRHGNDARKDRWNQLKPERDGWHRIWLGELVHEWPRLAALSLSDNFNRADSTNINTGAPFTWGGTEIASAQIVSNALRNQTTNANSKFLRAESDLPSSNHFSQLTLFLSTTTTLSAGPRARCNATDSTCYGTTVAQNSANYRLSRYDAAGGVTILATKTTAVSPTSGKVLRIEVNGSTLTSLLGGGTDSLTTTDTTITTGVRAGIVMSGSTGGVRVGGDDWSAGDLFNTVPATASTSITLNSSATGTRTVLATASRSITLLSSATATRGETATAAGSASLIGTATGIRTVPATASASLALHSTATGTRGSTAAGTGGLSLAGASTATRLVAAAAAAALVLGGVAVGTRGETATGAAAVQIDGQASGTRTVPATAGGSLELAGSGAATTGTTAAAIGGLSLSASGSATRTVNGMAAGGLSLTGAAPAGRIVEATASGGLTLRGRGVAEGTDTYDDTYLDIYGANLRHGAGTGQLQLAGTGTATVGNTATAAGSLSIAGAAVGTIDAFATATGLVAVHSAATATRGLTATALGLLTIDGQAAVIYRDITVSAELVESSWAAILVESHWTANADSSWKAEVTA